MNPRRKLLHQLVGLWFAAGFLVGPTVANAVERVIVGIPKTASDVFFFLANEKGYFRDQGIEVEFKFFPSAAQMIAPLGIGDLDVAAGTVAAGLYNAVERGIKMRIVADKGSVAPGYEWSTLLIRKDLVESGRYKSLSDLRGLTIATASKGAGSESSLNEALKKGGLNFNDVKVVYMGFAAMYTALANKGIDGCISAEPAQNQMIRAGLAVRGSPDTIYPGQQSAVLLYSESFANNTSAAKKFMVAYLRAVRSYNDAVPNGSLADPRAREIVSLLTEHTEIKDRATYETMAPFAADPDGKLNLTTLDNDLEFFRGRGLVGPNVKVKDVVDTSFASDAAKELGPYAKSQ